MDYEKLINDNGMYLYRDDSFNTESVSLCFQAENGNRENADIPAAAIEQIANLIDFLIKSFIPLKFIVK